MVLDQVKEWLYGCTHCGTCKDVLNIFAPACPSGERYKLESYYPSGKILIARGVADGILDLGDEDILERIYACTGCLSCEQQCGVYHHQHIFEVIKALRTEAVTQGCLNPAYMVMIDSEQCIGRVGHGMPFCRLADEAFAIFREGNHGRGGAGTFRILDHLGILAVHDSNAGIGGTQVNTDYFGHFNILLANRPGPIVSASLDRT